MAKKVKPDFVMKKSAWTVGSFWYFFPLLVGIALAVLAFAMYDWSFSAIPTPLVLAVAVALGSALIPFIVWFIRAINVWDETISFYGNKVVHKCGIFKKATRTNILTHVLSVDVKQSFWSRVGGFGTITIDVMGPWDIDMTGIKHPKKAKAYLETIVADGMNMSHVLMN